MLKLRMCELSGAEHALWNGDIIATEECLVAGAAGTLGTGVNRAANGFACGCSERIKTDGAGHICSYIVDKKRFNWKVFVKMKSIF